jgi:ABC-2 type transport system ATP-binding protein
VVEELADRIAIVEHGRLIACGTFKALREQAAVGGSLEDVFLTLTHQAEDKVTK